MRLLPQLGLVVSAFALIGADVPEREAPPGEGVLCLGAMIYFADIQARSCHAGEDREFQKRLSSYVERFDSYLIRNTPGGEADLKRFKELQGLTPEARPDICEGSPHNDIYKAIREGDQAKIDVMVDKMLMRDGAPSFGDCV